MLLEAHTSGAKLTDVIHAAIEPFRSHNRRRFFIRETPIKIGPQVVLPFAMSLNELCTNAVKYGALSNSLGSVEITSAIDEKTQRYKLTWTEKNGPTVREPTRRGFGTRLINRLAAQLRGDVQSQYEATGLVYELSIPLKALRRIRAS